jgi:hypothetical protein
MDWLLRNVWVINKTTTTIEKVEENIRYVRLIFPIKENVFWNVNNKNNIAERDISYVNINLPESIGVFNFDSVITTGFDDGGSVLVSRESMSEKYAKNVGLIYKEDINVKSQPVEGISEEDLQLFYATPIFQRVSSGYKYSWTINSFGVE